MALRGITEEMVRRPLKNRTRGEWVTERGLWLIAGFLRDGSKWSMWKATKASL